MDISQIGSSTQVRAKIKTFSKPPASLGLQPLQFQNEKKTPVFQNDSASKLFLGVLGSREPGLLIWDLKTTKVNVRGC